MVLHNVWNYFISNHILQNLCSLKVASNVYWKSALSQDMTSAERAIWCSWHIVRHMYWLNEAVTCHFTHCYALK